MMGEKIVLTPQEAARRTHKGWALRRVMRERIPHSTHTKKEYEIIGRWTEAP